MLGRKSALLAALVAGIGILVIPLFRSGSDTTAPKRRQFHHGRNQSVLFLSNIEHGLANVVLATSHALLIHHSDIEVHYASFPSFKKHVSAISDSALRQSPGSNPITFHELKGPRYWHALNAHGHFISEMMHPPGLIGSTVFASAFPRYLAPWSGSQYLALYEQISQIIDEVDPALIALDLLLGPALDAAKEKNRSFAILSPNTLLDIAGQFQPWGSMFWKYPA
jgi:hypothetical protein